MWHILYLCVPNRQICVKYEYGMVWSIIVWYGPGPSPGPGPGSGSGSGSGSKTSVLAERGHKNGFEAPPGSAPGVDGRTPQWTG